MSDLFDVLEIEIKTPNRIHVLERNKTKLNAEAIVNMAVMRRGVENSFFTTAPSGRFSDGDMNNDVPTQLRRRQWATT